MPFENVHGDLVLGLEDGKVGRLELLSLAGRLDVCAIGRPGDGDEAGPEHAPELRPEKEDVGDADADIGIRQRLAVFERGGAKAHRPGGIEAQRNTRDPPAGEPTDVVDFNMLLGIVEMRPEHADEVAKEAEARRGKRAIPPSSASLSSFPEAAPLTCHSAGAGHRPPCSAQCQSPMPLQTTASAATVYTCAIRCCCRYLSCISRVVCSLPSHHLPKYANRSPRKSAM